MSKKTKIKTYRCLCQELEKKKISIGKERDELRNLLEEYNSIADSLDEAYESLEHAVGSLSQYV